MENEFKSIYEELFESNKDEIDKILNDYQKALDKKEEYELGFNVFSLVSDTYYKENLHSAILKEILDPNGKHKEGDLYLKLFIEYVKKSFTNTINLKNYEDAVVYTELGKIDILIHSKTHAIIIENKINDAEDMENQVLRYYLYCKEKLNIPFENIDAIIYLTKEGKREPKYITWTNLYNKIEICTKDALETYKKEIPKILKAVSCFDIKNPKDLCNGWLDMCIRQSNLIENIFILKQYKQLLKHLRQHIMEMEPIKEFDTFIRRNNLGDKIEQLINLYNERSCYFLEIVKTRIEKDNTNLKIILNINSEDLRINNIWNCGYIFQIIISNEKIQICVYTEDVNLKLDSLTIEKIKSNGLMADGDGYSIFIEKRNLYNANELNELIEKINILINII